MIHVDGEMYIGITAKTQTTEEKSLRYRFGKHLSRAVCEEKPWPLYVALKRALSENLPIFCYHVLTVCGKLEAHSIERELIFKMRPKLNFA
jgi:hypothetical protein